MTLILIIIAAVAVIAFGFVLWLGSLCDERNQ
jgi:hypothetical protein